MAAEFAPEAIHSGARDARELDWLRQAQARVGEALHLLLHPDATTLNRSAPLLEAAIQCLERVERSLRAGNPGRSPTLLTALGDLKKETLRAGVLLAHAAAFYLGWARVLYAAACGYTASGGVAEPRPAASVSVEA